MKKAKPIRDVAALSGVGRTTVSRVLKNGSNVHPKERLRVLQAVEALYYTVNTKARFLAGRRSQTLALVNASDPDAEPNSYCFSGLKLGSVTGVTPAHRGWKTMPPPRAAMPHMAAPSARRGCRLCPWQPRATI